MKFSYEDSILLDTAKISEHYSNIEEYQSHLRSIADTTEYKEYESSLRLPRDTKYTENIQHVRSKFENSALKYIFVIGIGGSNLGTQAIYNAIHFDVEGPQLLFLDTVDTETLSKARKIIHENIDSPNTFLINLISKSGMTLESVFNFEILTQGIDVDAISERIVVTTNVDSPLWDVAGEGNFHRLQIPEPVGGRYSVLSAVGQFPLGLAGINVDELLNGARAAVDSGLSDTWEENDAFISAASLYLHYLQNTRMHDVFLFNTRLESLGKWYRQLIGESLGKTTDIAGNTVHAGIIPTVSIGSTDLHSILQLYIGADVNAVTTFIGTETTKGLALDTLSDVGELLPEIHGETTDSVIQAILEAVQDDYREHGMPFMTYTYTGINAYELGYFMQIKMIETMYLGHLLNINAFDQPNVEGYKHKTRNILQGRSENN